MVYALRKFRRTRKEEVKASNEIKKGSKKVTTKTRTSKTSAKGSTKTRKALKVIPVSQGAIDKARKGGRKIAQGAVTTRQGQVQTAEAMKSVIAKKSAKQAERTAKINFEADAGAREGETHRLSEGVESSVGYATTELSKLMDSVDKFQTSHKKTHGEVSVQVSDFKRVFFGKTPSELDGKNCTVITNVLTSAKFAKPSSAGVKSSIRTAKALDNAKAKFLGELAKLGKDSHVSGRASREKVAKLRDEIVSGTVVKASGSEKKGSRTKATTPVDIAMASAIETISKVGAPSKSMSDLAKIREASALASKALELINEVDIEEMTTGKKGAREAVDGIRKNASKTLDRFMRVA